MGNWSSEGDGLHWVLGCGEKGNNSQRKYLQMDVRRHSVQRHRKGCLRFR